MSPDPAASPAPASALERWRAGLTGARRAVLRRRRPLAALFVVVGVLAGVRAVAPAPAPTAVVLVAARDLGAGRPLAPDDLTSRALPVDAVPTGALRRHPGGRLLAAPLRRGEVLTDVRLTGPATARELPPGAVAAPVRLSDAGQAALLAAGDRIDVLVGDPRSSQDAALVAGCAVVLAVPGVGQASDGALPGRLAVLAVDVPAARRLGVAAASSYVTFTWCREEPGR
ncbi:SAF domain-containing protein [Nocardioides sp.]|uniref:SAF domain-containing protein n=1 Tax=Nocardioides sp. TaxID=35761 RepID=UPI0035117815